MTTARISHERRRGCGYRKAGGLYLVSGDGFGRACGKLPVALTSCAACGEGIKPARGFTWIEPPKLLGADRVGCKLSAWGCGGCPFGLSLPARAGLIWIGDAHYTPTAFIHEAGVYGISRRISRVPRDLVLGETWIFLAHRKALTEPCACIDQPLLVQHPDQCERCEGTGRVQRPGLFYAFQPTAIEKVVTAETPQDELDALGKRGIDPVIVVEIPDQPLLPVDCTATVAF